jgi:serine/threonine-protein kinase
MTAGTDPPEDPRLAELLDQYVEALQAGQSPDRSRLLADHPELADLVHCLDSLHELARHTRGEAPPQPEAVTLFDPAAAPWVEGTPGQFGNFELLEEIGRGGMGVVYKARQKDLDRLVAVKMILASNLASPDQVRRFHAEARAAARLQHPHIVQVHDAGQVHGQHYFVMEYVDGPSLADLLDNGPLPPVSAARLLATVARAVAHLHEQGIVHRDLKPANILLSAESQRAGAASQASAGSKVEAELSKLVPKVTDFGLAKMLGGGSDVTRTGAIIGTPSYMAPEQATGRSDAVSPRSDVYSLGAMLYELLTGRPPFREETPLDTLVQVLESEPAPPSRLCPGLPRELEMICLKCLEKATENRYPSAAQLADDLERYLQGEAVEARPQHFGSRLRRWARREPTLASRIAALSLSAAVIQINFHFRSVPLDYHLQIMGVLAVWLLASLGFQLLLRRQRWASLARILWSGADVLLFTVIVRLAQAPAPLLVGYPVLVAASGLWFRLSLVWFTTVASAAAYSGLVVDDYLRHGQLRWPHLDLIYLVALVVLGYVIAQQVQRARTLSRYYEHRPPA